MQEILKNLMDHTAPSGWEDAVREYIRKTAAPFAREIRQDALGNLIVTKTGKTAPEKPVVLSAYMDEPGFMVKDITEEGFLKFGITGGVSGRALPGKQVLVGDDLHMGVIGMKPVHLTPKAERDALPKIENLYIDMGAENRAWAQQQVSRGDMGAFYGPCCALGTQSVFGKALGRSVTCAVLLKLMQQELPVDVTFVFTVQRLVGNRGAYAVAAEIQPGTAICLDICSGEEKGDGPIIGAGAVLPSLDDGALYDVSLLKTILFAVEKSGLMLQPVAKLEGRSDASVYQKAAGGAQVATLYCPMKNTDAPCQIVNRKDVDSMPELLMAILKELA